MDIILTMNILLMIGIWRPHHIRSLYGWLS